MQWNKNIADRVLSNCGMLSELQPLNICFATSFLIVLSKVSILTATVTKQSLIVIQCSGYLQNGYSFNQFIFL